MVSKPIKGMYVIKRDGRKEQVHLDKITSRIQKLCYGLNMDFIDPLSITLTVINGLYTGVTTVELDSLAAEIAASKTGDHSDYGILAARLEISNLHKQTKKQFSEIIEDLYNRKDKNGVHRPLISTKHHEIIMKHANRLNSCIIYDRDFAYNYFGFKLLERSYLLRINGKVVERPQHMLMRVAVGIHDEDIDAAIETYNYLSEHYFIHSSPTLLLAATPKPQLSSSFSLMMPDDSIEGIMKCLSQCATITQVTGGISFNIHNIRAKGSYIAGTNGTSNGLQPLLRVFNNLACFVDQHANRAPAAITVYLEPWHADIVDFLNLKRAVGKAEVLANDLDYALWIPDLFMKRVEADSNWSLMCPNQARGLSDCWGEEFEKLYEKYEAEGNFIQQVPARSIWRLIIISQVENGSPYLLYKDSCNAKSNQKNLGTIKSGSICADAIQFTSSNEIAVCNSASIAVNMFIKDKKIYDFEMLKTVTKVVTKNLDKIIDVNYYPEVESENSNKKHRPIGISVQGLADAFVLLGMPYDSDEAQLLNKQIFETLYYGALEASCELAEKFGKYSSYENSPASKGILQYDMWGVTPSNLWNWDELKVKISKHGLRNSLLIAARTTTSTAEILGNNPSFGPFVSNIYSHHILSSEYNFINKYLLKDLNDRGLWDDDTKNKIIENKGCIQKITVIPDDLKAIYKTVWDISNKNILNLAADRAPFIDQSQSLQLYIENTNYGVITSMHFYAWRKGLKTGVHHLHKKNTAVNGQSRNKIALIKMQQNGIKNGDGIKEQDEAAMMCSLNNPGSCEMCSA